MVLLRCPGVASGVFYCVLQNRPNSNSRIGPPGQLSNKGFDSWPAHAGAAPAHRAPLRVWRKRAPLYHAHRHADRKTAIWNHESIIFPIWACCGLYPGPRCQGAGPPSSHQIGEPPARLPGSKNRAPPVSGLEMPQARPGAACGWPCDAHVCFFLLWPTRI